MGLLGFDGHESHAVDEFLDIKYYTTGIFTDQIEDVDAAGTVWNGRWSYKMSVNDLHESPVALAAPTDDYWVFRAVKYNTLNDTNVDRMNWLYTADPDNSSLDGFLSIGLVTRAGGFDSITIVATQATTTGSGTIEIVKHDFSVIQKDWLWIGMRFQFDSPYAVEVWVDGIEATSGGGGTYGSPQKVIDWAGSAGLTGETATGGSSNTLIDSDVSPGWSAGQWDGFLVKITGGTGSGQVRNITSTSSGTPTIGVAPNWTTNPDSTSVYDIFATRGHEAPCWGIIPEGAKVTSGSFFIDNFAYYEEDVSGDYSDKIPYTWDIMGFQPVCDITGWQDFTRNNSKAGSTRNYRDVDDCNDGADSTNDHLSLAASTTGKDLWGLPDSGGSDDPSAVEVVIGTSESAGETSPEKLICWVDGENRDEFAPATWGRGALKGKLFTTTPGGSAWTKTLFDKLYIGAREDTGGANKKVVFNACVEVIGPVMTRPTKATDTNNADCDEPSQAAAVTHIRQG
ncbi:hypothetical protein LCGC14_1570490, partial [marine sediment metagenome]